MGYAQLVAVVAIIVGLTGQLTLSWADNQAVKSAYCQTFQREYSREAAQAEITGYELDESEYADVVGHGHDCF